nr:MAG: putative coat protein [Xinjiang sediment alphaflexi-like virus 1]
MPFPTAADLAAAIVDPAWRPDGNSIATVAQFDAVVTALDALTTGKPKDAAARNVALLQFAILCGDLGSSSKTVYPGSTADGLPFSVLASIVKQKCTVRQFCMLYSKLVYAWYKSHRPPANWARKGYTVDTQYAAFDFFDGLTHPDAFLPPGGDASPSQEEIIANQANRRVVIYRAAQSGGTHSTLVEITGARSSGSSARLALPPPPSS